MKLRCTKADFARYTNVVARLQHKFESRRCGSNYCEAEQKHVRADSAEALKYLRAGKCDDASIVLDHMELIARKR